MLPVLAYIKESGINEAKFIRETLKIDHGRFTNWKRRGVPQGMQAKIAAKIGKSTDEYLAEIGRPTGAAPKKSNSQAEDMFERYKRAHPEVRRTIDILLKDKTLQEADAEDAAEKTT